MKKVLVVSPHFPPINAADCHRVRMYLPYFRESGWDPVVIAVDPKYIEAPHDGLLLAGLPKDLEVHRTRAWPVGLTRLWGSRTIGRRCYRFVKNAGDGLLKKSRFDLVFFSTTAFSVFRLGPRWLKRFGVPFVIDLQDPWVNPYYDRHPHLVPPGGRLRYWFASRASRKWEPRVLPQAAGIVSVSEAYEKDLKKRYRQIEQARILTLPFGASSRDFDWLDREGPRQGFFDPADGLLHLVYVGASGEAFRSSLELMFAAFARFRRRAGSQAERFRFHFIGTSYAPGSASEHSVQPVANAMQVGDLVAEHPERVPYFVALRCLREASAILMPASDDAGYKPSKLHTCLLAGKPILAIAPPGSVAESTLGAICPPVTLVLNGRDRQKAMDQIERWWLEILRGTSPGGRDGAGSVFEAQPLAEKLCRFFDRVRNR